MTETFKIFQVDTKEAEKINASVNEAHHHDFEELIIGTEGQASLLLFDWLYPRPSTICLCFTPYL